MKLLKKLFIFVLALCVSMPLCACNPKTTAAKTLPNEISQEDWNSNRQYVKLSTGITMSYVEMGNLNGEVVILQHGMTDNSRSWSLAAPYFAKAGYHVYMPDLRGQGKSDETDGYYTSVTYATDLKAFFDAMKINKAILVGHSLGSYTVQTFLMMFPEKCSKVVLESSLPLKGLQNTTLLNMYNNRIKPLADDGHLSDSFMDYWYDCECAESKYNDVFEIFLTYMKSEAQVLSKKSWTNIILGMISSNIEDAYSTFVDRTTVPILILHGDDDTMAPTENQTELCTLLGVSSSNYRNYTSIGHNIHFVMPEEFSTDVLTWLSTGTLPE